MIHLRAFQCFLENIFKQLRDPATNHKNQNRGDNFQTKLGQKLLSGRNPFGRGIKHSLNISHHILHSICFHWGSFRFQLPLDTGQD